MRMPFGKHKGTPVEDLPKDYLKYLLTLENLRQPLKDAIEEALTVPYQIPYQPKVERYDPDKFLGTAKAKEIVYALAQTVSGMSICKDCKELVMSAIIFQASNKL